MNRHQRIYEPDTPEGFEMALYVSDRDFRLKRALPERVPGTPWEPIRFYLLKDDIGMPGPWARAQMPYGSASFLVLRDEAIDTVGAILRPHGELLPLLCDEADLVMFHAPLVANLIDEEHSTIIPFRVDGGIKRIDPLVFNPVGDVKAFRLAEVPRGQMFLTEDLVQQIEATGMTTGTKFLHVTKL